MSYLNTLLFGIYPYIAIVVCVVGSILRYDTAQYTWKASSSQLLESKQLRKGSIAFHIGVIMILAGHFVGLLTPHQVWDALSITPKMKQIFAIAMGGFFGVICFYGMTILVKRRLFNPRVRATSSKMDIAILLLLYVQLILGLISIFFSLDHLDGSEMLRLMAWAQSFVTFDPVAAAEAIAPVGLIYKLHVFLGMTLFLVFPFSRLVHVISVPVQYIGRNYQVVRTK